MQFKGEGHGSKDVLGKVFEYFLGEFALAEGKKGVKETSLSYLYWQGGLKKDSNQNYKKP